MQKEQSDSRNKHVFKYTILEQPTCSVHVALGTHLSSDDFFRTTMQDVQELFVQLTAKL
jgi:hypothetical protein